MFNPDDNPLPEIRNIEDIVEPQAEDYIEEEMVEEPPPPLEQKEIFSMGQKINQRILTPQLVVSEKPKKRGIGKRGKDKKPRVKKPLTEKQLAHLAKMRVAAAAKRAKTKAEKAEAKIEKENKNKTVTFAPPVMEAPKKVETPERRAPPPPKPILKRPDPPKVTQVTHPYPSKPQPPAAPNFNQFFTMMDAYENHKVKKREKAKTLDERLAEQRRAKPHPNRRVPTLQRPIPPQINPYADMFRYKGGIL